MKENFITDIGDITLDYELDNRDRDSFKFLFAGDLHTMSTNPLSRIDNYQETVWDKLDQIKETFDQESCMFTILPGDVTNSVSFSNNYPKDLRITSNKLKSLNTYGIIGNHDFRGNIENVLQFPIGTLISSSSYKIFNRIKVISSDFTCNIIGVNYSSMISKDEMDYFKSNLTEILNSISKDEISVFVIHQMVHQLYSSEVFINPEFFKDYNTKVVLVGHDHSYTGLSKFSNGVEYYQVGSITRRTSHSDVMQRIPKYAVFNFNKKGFNIKEFDLKVLPPEECFNLIGKAVDKYIAGDKNKILEFTKQMRDSVDIGKGGVDIKIINRLIDEYSDSDKVRDYLTNDIMQRIL